MKQLISLSCCIIIVFLFSTCTTDELNYLNQYNIRWDSQSQNSSESMPVGGGDIACNVWVENNDILIYISRTGSFDENSSLLKNGRLRITTAPVFFTEKARFSQEFHLKNGYISISAEEDNQRFDFKIWVDVHQPVIRLEAKATKEFSTKLSYENWRLDKRELIGDSRRISVGTLGYPGRVFTWPDSVFVDNESDLVFFHRNRNEELFMWKEYQEQELTDLIQKKNDPLSDLTFGGLIHGKDFHFKGVSNGIYLRTPYRSWNFESKKESKNWSADIVMHTEQTKTTAEWIAQLKNIKKSITVNRKASKKQNNAWWHTFWERSKLVINDNKGEKDTGWRIGRNYNLFRYMMACNAYGKYPTKFNGGLMTTDPYYVNGMELETPDYRNWGGGAHTCQNQRHLYWPLLRTGDFDFFKQQFDLYLNTLPVNMARTKKLWAHEGANYTEYLNIYGIPAGNTYGWKNSPVSFRCRPENYPVDELYNQWTNGHYSSQLEFAYMILQYYRYSGRDISEYIPFIDQATRFFDAHYRYCHKKDTGKELDENGKLVIYPSSALETYKNAKNPTDVIAGLRLIIEDLLLLPEKYVSSSQKIYWQQFLSVLPDIPIGEKDGYRVLLPAESWSHKQNIEIPQLYVLFPFPLYGIGKPDLQLVTDTWKHGHIVPDDRNYISWMQGGIFTARMGLVDEAKDYMIKKMDDAPRRFPAFWGPGHDWVPDFNWGGSGMMALQDMLMQETSNKILLFPAWPKDWDVDFKLHGEANLIIECKLKNGQVSDLKTLPGVSNKNVEIIKSEF